MGVVYLADDPRLRRQVALKVPRPEALVSAALRARFLREARAAAGLSHPNIVPVFESGEAGTLCYLVSAYCPGGSVATYLRGRAAPLPARAAAEVVAALADAVQHAHARGILRGQVAPARLGRVGREHEGQLQGHYPEEAGLRCANRLPAQDQ
jgi:serine/threonine protein kinase